MDLINNRCPAENLSQAGEGINCKGQRRARQKTHREHGDVAVRSGMGNAMLVWNRDVRPRPLSLLLSITSPGTDGRDGCCGAHCRGQTVLATAGPP